MAIEAKRGCGFRKVGGLYLVSGKLMAPCGGLPIPLHVCPTCGCGIKQTRGWTWINPRDLFPKKSCTSWACPTCPVSNPPERAGLTWIGEKFYSPDQWSIEALKLGVSRRIATIPRGLELGKTWVFVAHPKAVVTSEPIIAEHPDYPEGLSGIQRKESPGIFHAFIPTAIEMIVTDKQAEDAEFMAGLEKRGITPVIVPHDDPDHQGTVYDKHADEDGDMLKVSGGDARGRAGATGNQVRA